MEAATQPSGSSDRLDYAIVGAGVSGLYTAWRLLEDAKTRQMPMPKIGIFEMGDRTGGRLLTWLPAEGLRAELGGMRFFEQQELVWNLVAQLGFGKRDMTSFWVDGPNLRLLLRGVSTLAAGTDPTARYALPSNLRGQSAGKIIGDTITNVLQAPENWPVIEQLLGGLESDGLPKDREAWDRIKPELSWRGTPLWNVGFWNLLSDIHTAETYQYLVDALGYFSLAGNWNAAEAMEFIALDFTVTLYMSLDRGYSALPDTLAQEAQSLGAQIHLNTRLVRFDGQADGSSRLLLAPAGDAAQCTVDAEHLVLAMPRRSLELLAPSAEFDIQ